MKRLASTTIALFCTVAVSALAQDVPEKAHTETTTKQTGPGPTVKTKGETVTGIVKEYEPGKKIKISGPGDKSYSFDLDGAARVDGTIVVGQMAKVTYFKANDGTERVTVLSEATTNAQTAAGGSEDALRDDREAHGPRRGHQGEEGSRRGNGQGVRTGQERSRSSAPRTRTTASTSTRRCP